MCGFAAKHSRAEYNWKFGRITALDGAAPLFDVYPGAVMTKDDADFVDVIHTSKGRNILAGYLGISRPYGHVDFYPNRGDNQPRCRNSPHLVCNHFSAVVYFDASLWAANLCTFDAYRVNDLVTFQAKKKTQVATMGYLADKRPKARGMMYLVTTAEEPFCNV